MGVGTGNGDCSRIRINSTAKRGRRAKRVNLPYRPYSHPNPSKVIFSNKIQISKRYIYWTDKHISLFFAVLRSLKQGHSEDMRYPIILKAEHGANFCDVILPMKNVKIGKIEITKFYRMISSILLRKFREIALKLSKLFEIWISHHLLLKITWEGLGWG